MWPFEGAKVIEECFTIFNGSQQPKNDDTHVLGTSKGPQKIDIHYILRCTNDWASLKLSDLFLGRLYKAEDGDVEFTVLQVQNKYLLDISHEAATEIVQDLSKISHPNIASLRGYFFSTDIAVFVYEFGSGNLRTHLSNNSLAKQLVWKSRVNIVQGLLRAVHYLHSMKPQLYHRFIQPAYIFLTPEGGESQSA